MLKLEFVDHSQTSFWVVDDMFAIGSSPKNQLVIARDGIEEQHACVFSEGDVVAIEPFSVQAKISVNQKLIHVRTPLKVGDVISLAGTELRLIDPSIRQKKQLPPHVASLLDDANKRQTTSDQTEKKRVQQWKIKAALGIEKELIDIEETVSVGRDSSNDLVLEGSHISRRHAELFIKNEQLLVRDLDSSNGTSVNGERIKERAIYLGDEIAFDSVVFRVVVGKALHSINHADNDKTQFRPALRLNEAAEHDQSDEFLLNENNHNFAFKDTQAHSDSSDMYKLLDGRLQSEGETAVSNISTNQQQKVEDEKQHGRHVNAAFTRRAKAKQHNIYLMAFAILFLFALVASGIVLL